MPYAIPYIRVSTEMQADTRLGLDAQLEAIRRLTKQRGWPELEVCQDEGISGRLGLEERTGLARAVALYREYDAVIVVHSLSRLGRSQRLICELLDPAGDYGLQVVSATEAFDTSTPQGRAMIGMLAVFAQLEADLASQRTREALAQLKARGKTLGRLRMWESFEKGTKRRLVDPEKVALLRRVQALFASGGYSEASLCDYLNKQCIKSTTGKRWYPRTVHVALKLDLSNVIPGTYI